MAQQINKDFFEEIQKVQNLVEKLGNREIYGEVYKEYKIEDIIKMFMIKFTKVQKRYEIIEDKINRNKTKIFFFGKLSSGKTRLINGIIAEDLFVSASNHTTNCFVHISKSENENYKIIDKEKEFIYQNKNEACTKIEEISTDRDGNQMDKNEFVKIFIPINNDNKILTETVELIDTPGSGNRDKITKYNQEYAFDSDIFIFVLAHDITEQEEQFFTSQFDNYSTKLDIFILVNKWDATDKENETRYKTTYDSLFGKCSSLISKFSGPKAGNIKNKIFFVSADEIFDIRINKKNIPDLNIPKQKARYNDFLRFEKEILEYIQKLEKNKIHNYKSEIETLKTKLNKSVAEVSKKILCIDFELSLKMFEDYKNKILNFKKIIRVKCEKKLSKCKEKIEYSFTKMMDEIDFDTNELKKQVLEHYSKIYKSTENLKNNLNDQYNQLIEEIGNIQTVNKQENAESFENTFAKGALQNEEKIKMEFEEDLLCTSQKFVRILSIFPVVSFIATNIHFFRIQANKKNIYKKKFAKINTKIHEGDEEKLKILTMNISNIENYFTNEANLLIKQISEKIKLRNDYKKYLMDLFN